jgi:hypothetical protein
LRYLRNCGWIEVGERKGRRRRNHKKIQVFCDCVGCGVVWWKKGNVGVGVVWRVL